MRGPLLLQLDWNSRHCLSCSDVIPVSCVVLRHSQYSPTLSLSIDTRTGFPMGHIRIDIQYKLIIIVESDAMGDVSRCYKAQHNGEQKYCCLLHYVSVFIHSLLSFVCS